MEDAYSKLCAYQLLGHQIGRLFAEMDAYSGLGAYMNK